MYFVVVNSVDEINNELNEKTNFDGWRLLSCSRHPLHTVAMRRSLASRFIEKGK